MELKPLPRAERGRLTHCAGILRKAHKARHRKPWLIAGLASSLFLWVWGLTFSGETAEAIVVAAILGVIFCGAILFDGRDAIKTGDALKPELDELKKRGFRIEYDGAKVSQRTGPDAWSVGLDPFDLDVYDDVVSQPERFAHN